MDGDTPLRDESVLNVPEHVLSRRVAHETVLLNLDSEVYFGLDGVGTRFWDLVEAGTTFGDAVATLLDEYSVERDALVADLTTLIDDLQGNGLVLVTAA